MPAPLDRTAETFDTEASRTDVSVCVAVWKRHRPPNLRTIRAQLDAALDGLRAELIVVLNGIGERRADVPSDARVVRFELNRGVPPAWNAAGRLARGRFICFLNDDVSLGAGAIRRLCEALERTPDAGVVGPVGTRWDLAAPRHLSHIDLDGVEGGTLAECEVVSGFMFATPADVFSRAGGFDEAYAPCGFEEVDYCTTARLRLGLRCFAVAGVPYEHRFGISAARARRWRRVRFDGRSETIRTIAARNRRHFREKWRSLTARG